MPFVYGPLIGKRLGPKFSYCMQFMYHTRTTIPELRTHTVKLKLRIPVEPTTITDSSPACMPGALVMGYTGSRATWPKEKWTKNTYTSIICLNRDHPGCKPHISMNVCGRGVQASAGSTFIVWPLGQLINHDSLLTVGFTWYLSASVLHLTKLGPHALHGTPRHVNRQGWES